MTLREFFKHIDNKTTLVDLCTPLWRKIETVEQFEKELSDKILDKKISNWNFTDKFLVDI